MRNRSNVDFDSVVVRFPDQTEQFGALGVGQVSDYRRVARAYRYAYTEARSGERLYVLQPFDFFGESLLRPGRYTYELTGHFPREPSAAARETIDGFLGMTLKVDWKSRKK